MSITGNLRTLEFAELLQWLAQGQKTGALVVENGRVEKRIYFSDGRIISSESNNPKEHLGSFMIREGLIDEATLARAVKLQESTQILLGKVLVTLGTITEEELHKILRKKTEESLYEMFNWTEGEFRFLPDDLPKLPMVPLEIDVTNVVLEGAKRFDEARRDREQGTGDYGREIEEVLSSEIFQGIEVDETVAEDSAADLEVSASLTLPDTSAARERPSAEVRGYYSGSRRTSTRTPMVAAAAAAAAIGIGVVAYFLLRPEAAAGTPSGADVETVPPVEIAHSLDDVEDLLQRIEAPAAGGDVVPASAEPEPPQTGRPTVDPADELEARYQAELAALKKQLQQAQLAAAQRDEAMERVAELEDQVDRVRGASPSLSPDAGSFAVARLQNSSGEPALSAGGDEAPPLGSPVPTTDADREEGTDFAADMVDSAPQPTLPELDSTTLRREGARKSQEVSAPVSEITPPMLLTRPQPRYPIAALRLGKEAVVTLRLLIDVEGKVADVERIGEAAGLGFDKAAVNAALASKWRPGTENGEPIEMWAEMRIAFKP